MKRFKSEAPELGGTGLSKSARFEYVKAGVINNKTVIAIKHLPMHVQYDAIQAPRPSKSADDTYEVDPSSEEAHERQKKYHRILFEATKAAFLRRGGKIIGIARDTGFVNTWYEAVTVEMNRMAQEWLSKQNMFVDPDLSFMATLRQLARWQRDVSDLLLTAEPSRRKDPNFVTAYNQAVYIVGGTEITLDELGNSDPAASAQDGFYGFAYREGDASADESGEDDPANEAGDDVQTVEEMEAALVSGARGDDKDFADAEELD